MTKATWSYVEVLDEFRERPMVTIAAGTTCACLGDERNLREFLVADETARQLRQAGHTVFSLLIDDSLDPLTFPALRVAVHKDERLQEKYRHWCGKPIARLPDPWGCHESWAAHFEHELLERLHALGCHPTLISTAQLYERGVYRPYVTTVLERYEQILHFIETQFKGYHPEKLFWVLCPHCGFIDETQIESVAHGELRFHCHRCEKSNQSPFEEVHGKLNWKLDCAARWAFLNIDAEPFNKAYLEPQCGSFYVSQALSQEFFGGHPVFPLHYGLIKLDRQLSFKLLETLPHDVLRQLLVERPTADLNLTRNLVVTAASRYEVLPNMSYLDFVKQLLPAWLLKRDALTHRQHELVARGAAFAQHFLDIEIQSCLPKRELIEEESPGVIQKVRSLLLQAIRLRQSSSEEEFNQQIKHSIGLLGTQKKEVLHRLRLIVGQSQGLPAGRFLYLLPLDYLQMLEYMLELRLTATLAGPHPSTQPRCARESTLPFVEHQRIQPAV